MSSIACCCYNFNSCSIHMAEVLGRLVGGDDINYMFTTRSGTSDGQRCLLSPNPASFRNGERVGVAPQKRALSPLTEHGDCPVVKSGAI